MAVIHIMEAFIRIENGFFSCHAARVCVELCRTVHKQERLLQNDSCPVAMFGYSPQSMRAICNGIYPRRTVGEERNLYWHDGRDARF